MTQSKKRPAVVLGSTGAVGQRFIERLSDHLWFDLVAVAASEKRVGQPYGDACRWLLPSQLSEAVAAMPVAPIDPARIEVDRTAMPIAFSALPADIARGVEPAFAEAGYAVFSNASAFRMDADVPLLIPEVNPGHAALVDVQRQRRGWSGFIATNPNCTTTGIALALKPLHDAFGIRQVFASTLQAVSGAGYPGVASLDVVDNVLPLIPGEEEKMARELRVLLGSMKGDCVDEADCTMSAHANRIPVVDGHTICLSIGFDKAPSPEEAVAVLDADRGSGLVRRLPSSPERAIIVRSESDRPQPRLDRDAGGGMTVSVGRVRSCPLLDVRMVVVVHNTVRGAALGSILNAEALVEAGVVS